MRAHSGLTPWHLGPSPVSSLASALGKRLPISAGGVTSLTGLGLGLCHLHMGNRKENNFFTCNLKTIAHCVSAVRQLSRRRLCFHSPHLAFFLQHLTSEDAVLHAPASSSHPT